MLIRNNFEATFLSLQAKQQLLLELKLDSYCVEH